MSPEIYRQRWTSSSDRESSNLPIAALNEEILQPLNDVVQPCEPACKLCVKFVMRAPLRYTRVEIRATRDGMQRHLERQVNDVKFCP